MKPNDPFDVRWTVQVSGGWRVLLGVITDGLRTCSCDDVRVLVACCRTGVGTAD